MRDKQRSSTRKEKCPCETGEPFRARLAAGRSGVACRQNDKIRIQYEPGDLTCGEKPIVRSRCLDRRRKYEGGFVNSSDLASKKAMGRKRDHTISRERFRLHGLLRCSHPYVHVGGIRSEKIRKGVEFAEAERWLTPNLGYDPDA